MEMLENDDGDDGQISKFFTFYHFDSDPRFPPFLLYVRWNLGSLLNGDVFVMLVAGAGINMSLAENRISLNIVCRCPNLTECVLRICSNMWN